MTDEQGDIRGAAVDILALLPPDVLKDPLMAQAVGRLSAALWPAGTDELLHAADELIAFHGADPQGIGTAKPCECAQRAIDRGYMILDPDCRANRCKELRQ